MAARLARHARRHVRLARDRQRLRPSIDPPDTQLEQTRDGTSQYADEEIEFLAHSAFLFFAA